MTITDALRTTQYASGKSQEFMALELGVTRRTVQNWELGVSEPLVSRILIT